MLDEQNKIPNVNVKVSVTKKKEQIIVKNEPRVILADTSQNITKIITGKDQPKVLRKKFDPSYPILPHQTKPKKRSFKCKFCLRMFFRQSSFTRHLHIHMRGTPMKCYICQKKFYWRVNLDGHIRRHKGQKPFQCKICRKGFGRNSHLLRHMSVVNCKKNTKL